MTKHHKKLKVFGLYQIIGGVLGVAITMMMAFTMTSLGAAFYLLILIALGLMTFSIYSGFFLVKKQYLRGLNLSIINQALQIIGFGVLGFGFKYVSGVLLGIRLDFTNDLIIGLDFNITTWHITLNSNPDLTYISVNFVAIILLGFLFKIKDHFYENRDLQ